MEQPCTKNNYYWWCQLWLRRTYGKATKCESLWCTGKSKNYFYVLYLGFEPALDRNRYSQMCASCMRQYKMTPETKKKMSQFRLGKMPQRKEGVEYTCVQCKTVLCTKRISIPKYCYSCAKENNKMYSRAWNKKKRAEQKKNDNIFRYPKLLKYAQ